MVEIKEVKEEPKEEVKTQEPVKNQEEVKNESEYIKLTKKNCMEIGRAMQVIVLMLHPQSHLCHRALADKAFGERPDQKPNDIWTAFDYEAQFLFKRCGMNFKTLSMIRTEQIHYIVMDTDVNMRFLRGAFNACCIKCEANFEVGKKEGAKAFSVKNPNAGIVFEGFPFYTFNNLQFLCSETCWKKMEEELKKNEPKKIPPPPSEPSHTS